MKFTFDLTCNSSFCACNSAKVVAADVNTFTHVSTMDKKQILAKWRLLAERGGNIIGLIYLMIGKINYVS